MSLWLPRSHVVRMVGLPTIDPPKITIQGVTVLRRTAHHDPRGFLLETLRKDDREVHGETFAMSYTSLTVPGEKRDVDRWHVHQHQEDRFVVLAGEMILMLYDARKESPTHGTIHAIRMVGPSDGLGRVPRAKLDTESYLITIPIGVYHCIGNLSEAPFILQNYPTQLYSAADEGRVPFTQAPVPGLGGETFGWEKVEVRRP